MNGILCSFRNQPTIDRECRVAMWSEGRLCETCAEDCYRRGWAQRKVKADNKRLVKKEKETT